VLDWPTTGPPLEMEFNAMPQHVHPLFCCLNLQLTLYSFGSSPNRSLSLSRNQHRQVPPSTLSYGNYSSHQYQQPTQRPVSWALGPTATYNPLDRRSLTNQSDHRPSTRCSNISSNTSEYVSSRPVSFSGASVNGFNPQGSSAQSDMLEVPAINSSKFIMHLLNAV